VWLQNGRANPGGQGGGGGTDGGNVFINDFGGTVTNCIITGARSTNNYGSGSGVAMYGGLVTHCVITDNEASYGQSGDKAAGVYMTGGRLENCLIAYNFCAHDGRTNSSNVAGVRIAGGTMRNCTIVGNDGRAFGGIVATGGTVEYTIVAGNRSQDRELDNGNPDAAVGYWNSPDRFAGSVSDLWDGAGAPWNASCKVGTVKAIFKDAAKKDWQLGVNSPAIDIGRKVEAWEIAADYPEIDLAGRQRVISGRVDAGCFESKGRAMMVIVR